MKKERKVVCLKGAIVLGNKTRLSQSFAYYDGEKEKEK